ncbi:MAG: hypothetical protein O9322_04095 [Beijerinckiaceae bacterium]|nr:hypothetical protein [Beijerinckiaceae bacterium]MCZ8298700.1 hypothetical protein [Beijerinckiaceae bacterium]
MMPNTVNATLLVSFLAAIPGMAVAETRGVYLRADGARIEARVLDAPGCAPLAIISHGFGGNSKGNPQLAEALNRAGYRVVVPNHAESGPPALLKIMASGRPRENLVNQAANPTILRLREADVSAILATETRRCAVPFKVLAGHSMGGRTVLLEAGAGNRIGMKGADRFDAYIAVSPAGENTRLFPKGAMAGIRKPVLMITGTQDEGEAGGYEERLSAFEGLPPGAKRLAVITGATHIGLGGRRSPATGKIVADISVEYLAMLRSGRNTPATPRPDILFADK